MSITVADAYKLNSLQNVTILTGDSGLQNIIERMGILDYEFISYKMQGEFIQHDFVLSSFLFAKDDINLMIAAVKTLIDSGVSCLGIKNIYYKELPEDLIGYAKSHSFSIFLFGHDIYFEDILTEVTDALRSIDSQLLMEMKVDNLLHKDLSRTLVRELALELNPAFQESHCVIYCYPTKSSGESLTYHTLDRLKRNDYFQGGRSLLKYKQGMLAIISYTNSQRINPHLMVQEFMNHTNLDEDSYCIGVSNEFQQLHFLDKSVRESQYALQLCLTRKKKICYYESIGLYKLILPFSDTFWFREFAQDILEPLKLYDTKYSADLLQTAIVYIQQNGNIKKTAEFLFQHENTIRYRLNKMKELLHLDEAPNEFYAQLSIAIHMELMEPPL